MPYGSFETVNYYTPPMNEPVTQECQEVFSAPRTLCLGLGLSGLSKSSLVLVLRHGYWERTDLTELE